jgi:hypothetical protein
MSSADPTKRSGGVNKSAVSYKAKLHRIHAGAQATRVQFEGPIAMTWRAEGGDPAIKQAIAYRLAQCWNVLEGIPSALLEEGLLRDLCDAVDRGDLAAAQAIVRRWGDAIDMTNGRPHDCPGCLAQTTNLESATEPE